MLGRILHLVGPEVKVAVERSGVTVKNGAGGESFFPTSELCAVILATPKATITAPALAALGTAKVPLLVCDEKFSPISILSPICGPTNTAVAVAQRRLTEARERELWFHVVREKVLAQAFAIPEPAKSRLLEIAAGPISGTSESVAAKLYWAAWFRLAGGTVKKREKGTRAGINGQLDYGYAVIRTLVLRCLVCQGMNPSYGIGHSERPGGFPLADDLMEPLRPFVERAVLNFEDDSEDFRKWAARAASLVSDKCLFDGQQMALDDATLLSIQSFARAICTGGKPAFPKYAKI